MEMGDSAEVIEIQQEDAVTMETRTTHMVSTQATSHVETSQESSFPLEVTNQEVEMEDLSQSSEAFTIASQSSASSQYQQITQSESSMETVVSVNESKSLDENVNSIVDEEPLSAVDAKPIESPVQTSQIEPSATEPLSCESENHSKVKLEEVKVEEVMMEEVKVEEEAVVEETNRFSLRDEVPGLTQELGSSESAEMEIQNVQEETLAVKEESQPREEVRQAQDEEVLPVLQEVTAQTAEAGRGLTEETMEEVQYYDEAGVRHHTWTPRGKYDVPKSTVQYEDIVPINLPDVVLTEPPQRLEPELPKEEPQPQEATVPPPMPEGPIVIMTNGLSSPIEIPEGIPLLARILPKEEDRDTGDKKISLERLFTPAVDSGEVSPKRGKVFASSSFYRPDHPTIEDQVELAQRISFSLVDENNQTSRGQSMYIKRKKRSVRWIHQDPNAPYEYVEEDPVQQRAPLERTPMKLLMNPKGVTDINNIQQYYQSVLQSPEIVCDLQSPTGKGAALFAKRKKRMDKFIVDETTVQKAQQQQNSGFVSEQNIFSSSSAVNSSFSSSTSSSSMSKKQHTMMEYERQQDQVVMGSMNQSSSTQMSNANWLDMPKSVPIASSQEAPDLVPSLSELSSSAPIEGGAIYTAEVKVVQRAAVPNSPMLNTQEPQHSLLDQFSANDVADRRRSANFNLAAKGWGTYNKFYTPVTFTAS